MQRIIPNFQNGLLDMLTTPFHSLCFVFYLSEAIFKNIYGGKIIHVHELDCRG